MENTKPTLGIYGIQDRTDNGYPQIVHDHNLALLQNGKIESCIQLERYTRKKNDYRLHQFLPELINKLGLSNREMDVVFVNKLVGSAFISSNGQIRFEAPILKRLSKSWEEGQLWWFDRELNSYILNHELAHVFSCLPFFGEFKENSLLIHFDGGASLSNFSAWIYRMGKIIPVEHHWELKQLTQLYNANALVYTIFNSTNKNSKSIPEKLMSYAALGNYNEDIEFWLRQNRWFEDINGLKKTFIEKTKSDFNIELESFDQHSTFLQDVIATIQEIFMRETLMKIDDVNTLSNCKNLYYTGGCALNIQTNTALIDSDLFENVFIPPCPGDSGLSIGAAAFGEWIKGNKFTKHSPYLNNWGINNEVIKYTQEDIQQVANLLAEGKIIGLFNGYGEVGSRSLGNRSIIGLPSLALANKISVNHKNREWYRPVSPIMLEKNALYFTEQEKIHPLSQYRLIDSPIIESKQNEIAGVVHSSGTTRIQTIFEKADNPFLYDLLTLLDEHYNVKALINTSFCISGEPLVQIEKDAIEAGKKMKLDVLVINGKIKEL